MLLTILTIKPVPDTLFGRWEIWKYFHKTDTTPLPEKLTNYDLKLGNHIAVQDTWYDTYEYGFERYEDGTPTLIIMGRMFLEDIDSIVLFVKSNFSCKVGGKGITRKGFGLLGPRKDFPEGTNGWKKVVLKPADMYDIDTTDTSFMTQTIVRDYAGKRRMYPKGMISVVISAIKHKETGVYYVRFEVSPVYVYIKKKED